MKKNLLITLLTFCVQVSFCQNLSDTVNVEYSINSPKRWSISTGIFTSGFALHSFPNLNQFLQNQRVVERNLSNLLPYIPLGIRFQNKRFQIQGTTGFSIPTGEENLNVKTGSIYAGYAISADRNNFFYLNLGIGFSEYVKTINVSTSQPTSLASAIQNGTGQSISLKNSQNYIDINIEFFDRVKDRNIGQSVRLGYRYGLKETPWSVQFIRSGLPDVPSDRISSIYLEAVINIPSVNRWKRSSQNDNQK
ncbi:MAG: hypothetical protein U5N85_14965 [Arcicella sp.]|nr:hypothetical protein [Arcicella sp.]